MTNSDIDTGMVLPALLRRYAILLRPSRKNDLVSMQFIPIAISEHLEAAADEIERLKKVLESAADEIERLTNRIRSSSRKR